MEFSDLHDLYAEQETKQFYQDKVSKLEEENEKLRAKAKTLRAEAKAWRAVRDEVVAIGGMPLEVGFKRFIKVFEEHFFKLRK